MKKQTSRAYWISVSLLVLTFVIATFCAEPQAIKHRFCIYQLKDFRWNEPPGKLAEVGLEDTPLLTENDLVSYDWETHTLTLTKGGGKTFADKAKAGFVVIADGQRCYRGRFWSSYLSSTCNQPVILVNDLSGDTVQIQRAYPSARFASGDDPRPDERIQRVLRELGKLKEPVSATEQKSTKP